LEFRERAVPALVTLAHLLIDRRCYECVPMVSSLLAVIDSRHWDQMPADERLHALRQVIPAMLHPRSMQEVLGYNDPTLKRCVEILIQEERRTIGLL
jgi:hypothetical protein